MANGEHGYDSFLVRLWHDPETATVLRAEIEHVQSGATAVGVRAAWSWITDWLRDSLSQHAETQPDDLRKETP